MRMVITSGAWLRGRHGACARNGLKQPGLGRGMRVGRVCGRCPPALGCYKTDPLWDSERGVSTGGAGENEAQGLKDAVVERCGRHLATANPSGGLSFGLSPCQPP